MEILSPKAQCPHQLPGHHLIKVTVRNPPQRCIIRLIIPYIKVMKSFEHYEIVDRGGEEFMPALVVVSQSS